MKLDRVTLIGMNNPLSTDDRHALWPDPVNCTGWRVWKMLEARTGATQQQYIDTFRRVSLLSTRKWHQSLAGPAWKSMEDWVLERSDVIVLLGTAVRRAVLGGAETKVLGRVSTSIYVVPHPSGLNRWYNDPVNLAATEILLEELWARATGLYSPELSL